MKVMIDIPKEFERDMQDKFNEFFERVKCDINHSLKSQEISMCGNYERETAEMFLSAFEKATIIPDNATNGDMIKAMFPKAKYFKGVNHCSRDEDGNPKQCMYMSIIGVIYHPFPIEWWNAPYKKEVEE